jgi:predicted RNase H-like nuclease (RuvC/YqgF family)
MTIEATALATNSQDPIIVGLAFVLAVVIILVAIAKPMMSLVKDYKTAGVESAKAGAESTLFEQLQKQIKTNSEAIALLITEKNEWFKKALELEHEVDRLKVFEEMVNSMKARLAEKDVAIEKRDDEIRALTRVILEMKDSVHTLEMRLAKDEQRGLLGCAFRNESCEMKRRSTDEPFSGT